MLETIRQHGFSEVILSGGGEINGLFAAAGCVDEILITIYPLTLGKGIPLFGMHHPNLKLELLSSRQGHAGSTKNHYRIRK